MGGPGAPTTLYLGIAVEHLGAELPRERAQADTYPNTRPSDHRLPAHLHRLLLTTHPLRHPNLIPPYNLHAPRRLPTHSNLPPPRPLHRPHPLHHRVTKPLMLRLRDAIHDPQLKNDLASCTRRVRLRLDRVAAGAAEEAAHDVPRPRVRVGVHGQIVGAGERDPVGLNEQVGRVGGAGGFAAVGAVADVAAALGEEGGVGDVDVDGAAVAVAVHCLWAS